MNAFECTAIISCCRETNLAKDVTVDAVDLVARIEEDSDDRLQTLATNIDTAGSR